MRNTKYGAKRDNSYGKPSRFGGGKSGGNKRRGKRNNKKGGQDLDPNMLIKKAEPLPEAKAVKGRKFADLDIHPKLKQNIARKGFEHMTEIQDKTLEVLIEGHDVMGIANTGTGKTGAFLIPVIHRLLSDSQSSPTLVLVPTRELALQVQEEFATLTKGLQLFSTSLIGGTSVRQDIMRLKRRNHIIIGTPGRVIDLMNRNILKLRNFTTLILDEFDRMLDMGFVDDVEKVTEVMRNREQTILFSATENGKQRAIIQKLLDQPKEVRVSVGNVSALHIDQDIVRIKKGEDKFQVLLDMLKKEDALKVLVFAETKRRVSTIALKLKKAGMRSDEIHGDKAQNYRKRALDKFRTGRINILVATDVAARGIDVDDISHVINYQVPQNMESYVHRIGRTGRAGKAGKAFTLVD